MNKAMLNALEKRSGEGNLRSLLLLKNGADFWSNDYLGLAGSGKYTDNGLPHGSGGSRLLAGNYPVHESAEEFIARFHNAEAALFYNSGYMANLGLLSCVAGKNNIILYDELCHASIYDGMRLSPAKRYKFRHNDTEDLNRLLERFGDSNCFVVTESVFSMDGDLAPLNEIALACKRYNAELIVDEAHALGVFGDKGQGLCPNEINGKEIFARVYTYGKALGLHGAAVVGSELLKKYLINFSRPFIYTTAAPPVLMNDVLINYRLISSSDKRERLEMNIRDFNFMVGNSGLKDVVSQNPSAIQTALTGHPALINISDKLKERGFMLKAVLSPTVPKGKERIRICIHAFNTYNEMHELLSIIKENI